MRLTRAATLALSFAILSVLSIGQQNGQLSGHIIDSSTGKGIQNLVVALIPPKSGAEPRHIATTDQRGGFHFDHLQSSTYLLQVTEGIYLAYRKEIFVADHKELSIPLEPTSATPSAAFKPEQELLSVATTKATQDPQLSAALVVYDITKDRSAHSSLEQRIILQDIIWRNAWAPAYAAGEPHAHINAVALSPDRKLLATAMEDHTARIIEASSGKELAILRGHKAPIQSVQFSHSGSMIATADSRGTVKLWDVQTRTDLGVYLHHFSPLIKASFSSDDSSIITEDSNNRVIAWMTSNGTKLYDLANMAINRQRISILEYDDHDNIIVVGYEDGSISFWNGTTGRVTESRHDFNAPIDRIAFSNDHKMFVLAGRATITPESKLIDNRSHKILARYSGSSKQVDLESGIFEEDGKLLLVGRSSSALKIWDPVSKDNLIVLRSYRGWNSSNNLIATNPTTVISWNKNTIRLMRADTNWLIDEARKHARSLTETECQTYLGTKNCP